jgi:hypothetical protein
MALHRLGLVWCRMGGSTSVVEKLSAEKPRLEYKLAQGRNGHLDLIRMEVVEGIDEVPHGGSIVKSLPSASVHVAKLLWQRQVQETECLADQPECTLVASTKTRRPLLKR